LPAAESEVKVALAAHGAHADADRWPAFTGFKISKAGK